MPLLVGTLGKAFGTFGAFVAGAADVIEFLLQKRAALYLYDGAAAAGGRRDPRRRLRIAARESWRRERVLQLARRFARAAADAQRCRCMPSATPIQPVLLGSAARVLRGAGCASAARVSGWSAIRPPTVPRGSARLRVTLSASPHARTRSTPSWRRSAASASG